ncbi:hypothetical protein [Algicola sagamiensis]|uniref:hypothetical protein n=1 Tax=Algicola sagamiensis TaxID=163869 RepID=UPI000369984E|nr:hypothetical protein [Algicola sagamiensis]
MTTTKKLLSVLCLAFTASQAYSDVIRHHFSSACVIPSKLETNATLVFDYDACNPVNKKAFEESNFTRDYGQAIDGSFIIKHVKTNLCMTHESDTNKRAVKLHLSDECTTRFIRPVGDKGTIKLKNHNLYLQANTFLPGHRDTSAPLILAKKGSSDIRLFLVRNRIISFEQVIASFPLESSQ